MAAHRSTYTGRYTGIGRLLQSPGMQRATAKAARRIQQAAEELAPVGDPAVDPHPGQYRNAFKIVPLVKNVPFQGKPRLRSGSRLINTAPHALHVEFGTDKVPKYAVLRRALDAAKINSGG
ncbi:HK97 gp10 family phage protein [Kitasatospora sp. MBT66]|uniref:HK97 gp10 family phage protein n=1 Tax=Kitasatospora sp. MBT66 TaxID=1444769 RepID=UPI0005B9DDE8|nr:HK97 gp10 family phage protein [Kitasatospora sp. MBT66]